MNQESTGTGIDTNTTTIIKESIDINTSLKFTFMLLNGKNYQSWTKTTRISLKGKGKLCYIDSTQPRLVIVFEAENWEVQDSIIPSWLLHSMESSISE
jgi:gag-polypeptide of LTR copia-type